MKTKRLIEIEEEAYKQGTGAALELIKIALVLNNLVVNENTITTVSQLAVMGRVSNKLASEIFFTVESFKRISEFKNKIFDEERQKRYYDYYKSFPSQCESFNSQIDQARYDLHKEYLLKVEAERHRQFLSDQYKYTKRNP